MKDWWSTLRPDEEVRRFLDYNRRHWPQPRGGAQSRRVVLLGFFTPAPSVFAFAHVANAFARRENARIAAYCFNHVRPPVIERIYDSFGARVELSIDDAAPFETRAEEITREIWAGLKSKWDVMNIAIEGVIVGDLIYDSYLRHLLRPTVDLQDERLRHLIHKAALITLAAQAYFDAHEVAAVIPDHTVYVESGIVARLAQARGIPVYLVTPSPLALIPVSPRVGDAPDYTRWPPRRKPHHDYHRLFEKLPPAQQEDGVARARAALAGRLSGQRDDKVLPGMSAYAAAAGPRIMADTDEPRMLVLMHDFCDAAHVFQWMLFPDFYEWISFLLGEAGKTKFRWYVKPHPNVAVRNKKDEVNQEIVAELRARFSNVTFLDPTTSNAQLVSEGVTAMFTMFGTSAHEFAYLGIPVVTAGDNPHTAYRFNFHPGTVEEYAALIARADRLQIEMSRPEIEEFYYMNYLYFWDHSPEVSRGKATLAGWGALLDVYPADYPQQVDAYVDEFFARQSA